MLRFVQNVQILNSCIRFIFPWRNNLSSVKRQALSFGKLKERLFLSACFVAIKPLRRDVYNI